MRIIHNMDEMTETARGWLAGGSVGFVPTMGSLHQGHISLVQAAHQECEISVASIFVNPIQFEESDDLLRYPRDLSRDLQLLSTTNIDVVFIPRTEDIYPTDALCEFLSHRRARLPSQPIVTEAFPTAG